MGHKLKQLFLRLWGELPKSVFIIIILRVGTCACSLACFQNMLKSRVYNFIPGGITILPIHCEQKRPKKKGKN